ncbi:hypothetical protein BASA50_011013 [Batrachochytrium salamandrivorans]|uniref:RAVE complex protein Rav1 C-terminal domain-containing protein n=1 Tax=Batrachochytrium salamandrivorans TaxID=1357716 RepID=A0ABQ8EWS1_9FUNG|nr:hypothetical protein BASA50_011013 [Batrachochytrium salamandrivorans]
MDTTPWLVESRVSLEHHTTELQVLTLPACPNAPDAAVLLAAMASSVSSGSSAAQSAGLSTGSSTTTTAAAALGSKTSRTASPNTKLTAPHAAATSATSDPNALTNSHSHHSSDLLALLGPLSSTYCFDYSPGSFIHWRLAPGRRLLQLRRVFLATNSNSHVDSSTDSNYNANYAINAINAANAANGGGGMYVGSNSINGAGASTSDSSLSRRLLQIQLPEPCLPNPGFFEDPLTRSLHILLVTITGSIFRIVLPLSQLLYADSLSLDNVVCYAPALFSSLELVPVLVHFSNIHEISMACGNGSLVHITCPASSYSNHLSNDDDTSIDESADPISNRFKYSEVELTESTYMSHLKSLARTPSKLFSVFRSVVAKDTTSTPVSSGTQPVNLGALTSPCQAISMSSLGCNSHLFVLTFCRDSRLRIWSIVARQCIRSIQMGISSTMLPRSDLSLPGGSISATPGLARSASTPSLIRQPLLDIAPRALLQIFNERAIPITSSAFRDEAVSFNAVCFLPQTTTGIQSCFVIYSGRIDAVGQLAEFENVYSQNSGSDGLECFMGLSISSCDYQRRNNGTGHAKMDHDGDDNEDSGDSGDAFDHEYGEDMDVDEEVGSQPFSRKKKREIASSLIHSDHQLVGATQWWTLWTLWDRSSASVIRYTQMHLPISSLRDSHSHHQPSSGLATGRRWMTVVSRPLDSVELPQLDAFENGMMDSNSYMELFLEHIFEPGRFSLSVISQAIDIFSGSIPHTAIEDHMPSEHSLIYANVFQRVISTVGSEIQSHLDEQTADSYFANYNALLLSTYSSFLALIVQRHQAETAPIGICYDPVCNLVVTLQKGPTLGFLRAADVFDVIAWGHPTVNAMDRNLMIDSVAEDAPLSLLAGDHLFTGHLRVIRSKSLRTDLFHFMKVLEFVDLVLLPPGFAMLIENEILTTRAADDSAIEDYSVSVLNRLTDEVDADVLAENLATLEQLTKSIGHFQLLITTLLDVLRQQTDDGLSKTSTDSTSLCNDDATTAMADMTDLGGRLGVSNATPFTNDIIASALAQTLSVRLNIIRRSVIALLLLKTIDMEDMHHYDVPSTVLRCYVDAFSAYSRMNWMSSQHVSTAWMRVSTPPLPTQTRSGIFGKGSNLIVPDRKSGVIPLHTMDHTPLLLHLLQHHYILDINIDVNVESTEHPVSGSMLLMSKITVAVESFIARLGLFSNKGHREATRAMVVLARKLLAFGHVGIVGELFPAHGRHTPAMEYIKGCVWIETLEWDKAAMCFLRAAGGDPSSSDLSLVILPSMLENGFMEYYRHVSDLFIEKGVLDYAVQFARSALRLIPRNQWDDQINVVRVLNKTIFKSCVDMADFDSAYEAVLDNPDPKSQRDCLRTFVSALCSAKDIHGMCAKYSFGSLSSEVESTLEFKARTGNVSLSKTVPNYYHICYAFYIYRGDYRRAAKAMYTLAHRLSSMPLPPLNRPAERAHVVTAIVAEQAQSLLAAMNSLTLVNMEHAWISVPFSMAGPVDRSSRSGISPEIDIDDMAFSAHATATDGFVQSDIDTLVHVIESEDIRKQYYLALAKLHLHARFPHIVQNTLSLQPGDAISMYCQAGLFDSAFSLAILFGMSLDRIFIAIVDRLGMAVDADEPDDLDEEGGGAFGGVCTRWGKLRHVLDRYDARTNGFSLHLVVINAVLKRDRREALPRWLIQPFQTYQSDRLVRIYLAHDCIEDAAKLTLHYINENTHSLPAQIRVSTGSRWISITVIEHVIKAIRLCGEMDGMLHRLKQNLQVYLGQVQMESQSLVR